MNRGYYEECHGDGYGPCQERMPPRIPRNATNARRMLPQVGSALCIAAPFAWCGSRCPASNSALEPQQMCVLSRSRCAPGLYKHKVFHAGCRLRPATAGTGPGNAAFAFRAEWDALPRVRRSACPIRRLNQPREVPTILEQRVSRLPGAAGLAAPAVLKSRHPQIGPDRGESMPPRPWQARGLRRAEIRRHPPGRLRARRRPRAADRGCPRRPGHARRRADHRGGGHRAGRRRLARRPARGAADAIQRRRQLHQHAVAAGELPHAVADAGDHAGRVGGVQSVAGADGHRDAAPC